MPTGFSQVLASIEPCTGPGPSVTVPPDWLQGRTVFGGMQMALGGRAMRAVLPLQAAAMPLRSAQMTFVGPLLGGAPIRMKAETLRAGKSTVHARCDLMHDDGKVACTVVGIFGGPRESRFVKEMPRPEPGVSAEDARVSVVGPPCRPRSCGTSKSVSRAVPSLTPVTPSPDR